MDQQFINAIELIINRIHPTVIYLFGSAVRGELKLDSDVDLAYFGGNPITPYDNFLLAQELADIFDRSVDLVNLNKSSSVFKAQVISTGKILSCCDETARMYFEMRTLKEYAMLNEERKEILDRIEERGTIYGE